VLIAFRKLSRLFTSMSFHALSREDLEDSVDILRPHEVHQVANVVEAQYGRAFGAVLLAEVAHGLASAA